MSSGGFGQANLSCSYEGYMTMNTITKDAPSPKSLFQCNKLGRTIGYIKFFDEQNLFGFITKNPDLHTGSRESDVFFHASEFKCKIRRKSQDISPERKTWSSEEIQITYAPIVPGKMVEFRLVETPKGFQAHDCVLVDYLINPKDLQE